MPDAPRAILPTRFTRGTKKRTFIAERPLKLKIGQAG